MRQKVIKALYPYLPAFASVVLWNTSYLEFLVSLEEKNEWNFTSKTKAGSYNSYFEWHCQLIARLLRYLTVRLATQTSCPYKLKQSSGQVRSICSHFFLMLRSFAKTQWRPSVQTVTASKENRMNLSTVPKDFNKNSKMWLNMHSVTV